MIISIKRSKRIKHDFNNPFLLCKVRMLMRCIKCVNILPLKAFQDLKLQLETSNIDLERLKPSGLTLLILLLKVSRNIEHITSIIINDQSKTVEFQTLAMMKRLVLKQPRNNCNPLQLPTNKID